MAQDKEFSVENYNFSEEEKVLFNKTMADFVIQRRRKPDMFHFTKPFAEASEFQAKIGHHLFRRVLHSSNTNHVMVEDPFDGKVKEMIMLGSNSYLGLNNHPRVKKAALDAIEKYGVGAGSPPHFSGTYDVHHKLEANLAWLKSAEEAMVFSSGYATNVGIISCFLGPRDHVIFDKLAHASIIDGAILSQANIRTFPHNDMDALGNTLRQVNDERTGDILVAVEGVYSMDGDIASLDVIYELVKKYNAKLMVDEAHATGVLGKTGKGSPEYFGLEGKIDIVMGTFSKSLGGVGGFVAAKKEIIKYLRYYSRAYFFAASPTPAQVAAQNEAVNVLRDEPIWHQKLWENIRFFHKALTDNGFDIENTETAITPILIGDTVIMNEVTLLLHKRGIFVNPVPFPAVARTKDRLRLSLSAVHTREDLETVLEALIDADKKYKFSKKYK
jgi:glycine C-acetyltransferase